MEEDTFEDCEFLSCLAHLNPGFCKIYHPDLGYVYLGDMGENDSKLNVAVMKCYEGSSCTGGSRAVHSGGAKGAVAPARKTKCFFSNIVSDFAGLFLVAILVRNLTKTEFAPADKKS